MLHQSALRQSVPNLDSASIGLGDNRADGLADPSTKTALKPAFSKLVVVLGDDEVEIREPLSGMIKRWAESHPALQHLEVGSRVDLQDFDHPDKVMQAIRNAGTDNPILLLSDGNYRAKSAILKNGADLIQAVAKERPDVFIIFSSGTSDMFMSQLQGLTAGQHYSCLDKPFFPNDLQAALNQGFEKLAANYCAPTQKT